MRIMDDSIRDCGDDRVHQQATGAGRAPGRWRRRLLWLPVWLLLFSVLQVLVLRVVPVPFSAFMLWRQLEAVGKGDGDFRVAYDWRDGSRISPHLAVAGRFRGFSGEEAFCTAHAALTGLLDETGIAYA